ncbi:MAG: rRNA maturation RNase YbeY [Muribaculum sp.]|nr:rRNA maturation RNase YbeY [Muribaculum sp.]
MKIEWLTDTGTDMPSIDTALLNEWIAKVVTAHSRVMGPLVYIFCDDEKIIEVNRQFLNHDYFTDIITFDYSRGRMVSGDMFISLDTVETNADLVGATFIQELHRVIIHGVLHLCGINDKGPGEREIMETNENDALAILQELQNNKD